jgi:phosphate transport system protein
MKRHFDEDFDALKAQILAMGKNVQEAVALAIKGLTERNPAFLEQVHEMEKTINQSHLEVDQNCISLLARQSPLGANLRLVFSVVKINADLERMGDQAVNIAHNAREYITHDPIKPLVDLPKMGEEVKQMVRDALESFVNLDVALAKKVLVYDDVVDALKNKIFTDLVILIKKDTSIVDAAFNLILIARNLERLGDHATNIAEEAIFDASGQDVRHSRVDT